ncbi:hypothetical protein [Granulicella sp. dw_53]|uniref:hypothetical protein n=1 Tax=Granulicella sp. dw_53 TaxID=2719792 RepID=UPI001BD606F7|nr:hypothetical protein [Granulicella sp. dw_53]
MSTPQTQTPASLRTTAPSRRSDTGNPVEALRPYLVAGRKGRTASIGNLGKTAFAALPKESEDARITGSTRSLDRRLLALNLRGTQMSVRLVSSESRIA